MADVVTARRVAMVVALALSTIGCPSNDRRAAPSAPPACTAFGQACELSAGKLGTCVQSDDCEEPAGCFSCQSQH